MAVAMSQTEIRAVFPLHLNAISPTIPHRKKRASFHCHRPHGRTLGQSQWAASVMAASMGSRRKGDAEVNLDSLKPLPIT